MCRKKRAVILTLGCKVNQYESEAFAEMLRRSGIEAAFAESDDNTGEPKPTAVIMNRNASEVMMNRNTVPVPLN